MSKTKKPVEKRYSRKEASTIIQGILQTNKIQYLSVNVNLSEFIIQQSGDQDSASAMVAVLEVPGIFGFDGDELTNEVKVVKVDNGFGVERTVTTFNREFAEGMLADGSPKPAAKPDGKSKNKKAKAKSAPKNKNTSGSDNESEGGGSEEPDTITRESVSEWSEENLNDVLESHGVSPKDYEGQTIDAKRAAVIKLVFID